jgi:phosphonoacetate hydrolase
VRSRLRVRVLLLTIVVAILVVVAPGHATDTELPKVVVILVDGLPASALTAEATPNLFALSKSDHATLWSEGRSVMPAVTNANHASLLTGTYPDAHGITGNYYWSREGAPRSESLDRPEALDVETIFTVAKRERSSLLTASITGKAKLERLFAAAPPLEIAPDLHWSDAALGEFPIDGRFGTDERTMAEAIRVLDQSKPDFLFIALPEVDLVSHASGPKSPEAKQAIAGADREIGRFVEHARKNGSWQRTIVFVTVYVSSQPKRPSSTAPRSRRHGESSHSRVRNRKSRR